MKFTNYLKCAALASLVAIGVAGCSKRAADKSSLEGHWTGYDQSQPNAKCTLVITGNQLEYHGADPGDWARGTFELNEKTQPAQMDLMVTANPSKESVGKMLPIIYQMQGDELHVAVGSGGSVQRPASFAKVPNVRLFTFKHD